MESGGYCIGTEIASRRLAVAHEWIEREGLVDKNYDILLEKDNSIPFLADQSVDIVWVLSVFNHMPDAELRKTLLAMNRILKPDGCMFAYYVIREPGAPLTAKTFRRSDEEMIEFLAEAGFESSLLDDWDDDLDNGPASESRMRLCRVSPS